MSQSITAVDETEFPPALWRRSGRPLRGQIIRAYLVVTFIVGAMIFLTSPLSWIVSGIALVLGLGVGYVVELYLARWERRVRAADKRQANRVLEQLRADRWIRNLAPHGWVALQEGILQMRRSDGRAAAKCFEQVRRLAGRAPSTTPLVSAQAHALLLAGDRKPAKDLFEELANDDALSARDRLDMGLLLLQESGSNREALAHLERAHEQLGGHPRVLAGLALAERKVGAEDAAYAHFVAADAALEGVEDAVAAEVLKRARKALRARIKQENKRARAQAPASDASSGSGSKEDSGEPRAGNRDRKREKKKNKKKNKKNKKRKDKRKSDERDEPLDAKRDVAPKKPEPAAKPAVASPVARPSPQAAAGAKPKSPLFAPPGARKPAVSNSPLFSPPRKAGPGPIPPPPVVPPPPKLGARPKLGAPPKLGTAPKVSVPGGAAAKPPSASLEDDGWGDALGAPAAPAAPLPAPKPGSETPKK